MKNFGEASPTIANGIESEEPEPGGVITQAEELIARLDAQESLSDADKEKLEVLLVEVMKQKEGVGKEGGEVPDTIGAVIKELRRLIDGSQLSVREYLTNKSD